MSLALALLAGPVSAAQVRAVHVTRHGPHFTITMRLALDAPPRAVFAALQDYAAMARYNPDLRRVRIEPTAQAGHIRLLTTLHVCVLIFCRTLHEEQIMTAVPTAHGGVLRATVVPGRGSFRAGQALWTVRPCPTGGAPTCLDARFELQPAFWVPPLIGPWLVRHKMYQEARRSGRGLEQIAARLLAGSAQAGQPGVGHGDADACRFPAAAAGRSRVNGRRARCPSAPRRQD